MNSVFIGMETTGHDRRKLAYFANKKGCDVRLVQTTDLKHHRELDESSSAKSYKRDALIIADITREGFP
jgi:transposase